MGRTAPDFADPRLAHPELPAATRILELFTCDGPGFNHDGANGLFFPETSPQGERFDLTRGFTGRGTRGLLNVNTASVEALRALPNWYKAVGVDSFTPNYAQVGAERFPRTWMAESAASYRDGYSGLTGTHGLPVPRTFFDLRDTIHTVNPNFRQFIVKPSDFITHTLTYKDGHDELYSPNFSRYPDPSFPELHPYEIHSESEDYPKSLGVLSRLRMVSPRGFRTIGELRLVDHRQVRGIGLLRPDEDPSGVPFLAPGWLDLYGPASHSDIEGTQVDQQFDSESFFCLFNGRIECRVIPVLAFPSKGAAFHGSTT